MAEVMDETGYVPHHHKKTLWAERRKTGLLKGCGNPEGEAWCYDKENRQPAPADL